MYFCKKTVLKNVFFFVLLIQLAACTKIDVFERNISFRNQAWQSGQKPTVTFSISDTASLYNLYVVLRHSDAYNYNNIWMNVFTRSPGDTIKKQSVNLQLANNQNGWLGFGMDDIYEHRIRITSSPIQFKKPGDYQFAFEQIMRDDPLEHVLNVGLRIERAQ